MKTLRYLNDFGDGWERTIKIERLSDPKPGVIYPRLIEAASRCPLEDAGRLWGYGEFIEALSEPTTSATSKCANGSAKSLTGPHEVVRLEC